MKTNLAVRLFLTITLCHLAKANIIYDGKFPTNEFRIVDNHFIEFPNPFRPNAVVKFSFEDGNITRVEHKKATFWSLNMFGDTHNTVNVYNDTAHLNKTAKYRFSWYHVGLNLTREPEICFDTTFNNAKW